MHTTRHNRRAGKPALHTNKNMRIFIKGIEITDIVRDFKVMTDSNNHVVDQRITLELIGGSNIIFGDDEDYAIYIGDIPTKEFIAEMVKLRLQR